MWCYNDVIVHDGVMCLIVSVRSGEIICPTPPHNTYIFTDIIHNTGFGKLTYRNGASYEGMWKDDVKHGEGKMTFANGKTAKGKWVNDKKV